MSENAIVDLKEVFDHMRAISGHSCFVLNEQGGGSMDLGAGRTLRWSTYPEFVQKFRGLHLQAAEKRVLEDVLACFKEVAVASTIDHPTVRRLSESVIHLQSLGADHE